MSCRLNKKRVYFLSWLGGGLYFTWALTARAALLGPFVTAGRGDVDRGVFGQRRPLLARSAVERRPHYVSFVRRLMVFFLSECWRTSSRESKETILPHISWLAAPACFLRHSLTVMIEKKNKKTRRIFVVFLSRAWGSFVEERMKRSETTWCWSGCLRSDRLHKGCPSRWSCYSLCVRFCVWKGAGEGERLNMRQTSEEEITEFFCVFFPHQFALHQP